ncbi:hypothetical protein L7F22_001701 [Adiantum nelumboides]|nr:hypothetical protein [Adiantum nelumboides]
MAINTATALSITLTLSIYILHAICTVVPVRLSCAHDAAEAQDPLHTATSVLLHVGEAQALLDFKKGIIDDPLGGLIASWSIDRVNNQSSSAHITPALLPGECSSKHLCRGNLRAALPSKLWNLISYVKGFILVEFWQLPLLTFLVVWDREVSTSIDNSYIDGTDDRPFKFHSSLPSSSSFQCCQTITELVVDGVNLTGEIPPSLGQSTALQMIELSHGSLKGEIPKTLGNLSNLKLLNLQSHMLLGEIPPDLVALAQLKVLDLSKN